MVRTGFSLVAAWSVAFFNSPVLAAPATPVVISGYVDTGHLYGPYVGANASGFSAGVMTLDGTVGYNFDGFGNWGGREIYTGVEASLGLQQPSGYLEAWGAFKAGPELSDNVWLYGRAAVGAINGTGVYSLGGGVEAGVGKGLSVYGELLGRAPFGYAPIEFGGRLGVHYYLNSSAYDVGAYEGDDYKVGTGSLRGAYLGFNASAYSAGVLTLDGTVGYNFDSFGGFGGTQIYTGLEASLGIQQPSGYLESWAALKAGPALDSGTWLYGRVGLGNIGGTSVYSLGAGIEKSYGNNLSGYAEFSTRGAISYAPTEIGIRLGAHYWLQAGSEDTGPYSPARAPSVSELFGPDHAFYAGTSLGFVPSAGAVIPSLDFGVNCMKAADLELGVRGRIGIQLPSNYPELWGGVQVALPITPQFKVLGFGEAGYISTTLANSLGAGIEYRFNDTWAIGAEAFFRGPFGSFTETGARINLKHYWEPIDTRVDPDVDPYFH